MRRRELVLLLCTTMTAPLGLTIRQSILSRADEVIE
jgi:hypothetical protein